MSLKYISEADVGEPYLLRKLGEHWHHQSSLVSPKGFAKKVKVIYFNTEEAPWAHVLAWVHDDGLYFRVAPMLNNYRRR